MQRVLVVALVAAVATAVPIRVKRSSTINENSNAKLYLSKYGYMTGASNPENAAMLSEESWRESIREFQAFAGLNQTGELDTQTIEMMNRPRCGNADIVGHGTSTRKKRYALQGSRWRVRKLTYKITKYPTGLNKRKVDDVIERAFNIWAKVSTLSFSEAGRGKVNIEIRFESGEHGDGDPFDGRAGTLAHAYFPIYGGDAHFDDEEVWTFNSFRGTNLFQVAAHEFGHSLGLSHSDVRSALMAPFYQSYDPDMKLDEDDISAIQILYGKNKNTEVPSPSPNTTPKPPPGNAGKLCTDSSFDAISTMPDGQTYVFKGSRYWKLTDTATAAGYPKDISDNWDGLPGYIDTAFTWNNNRTFFFKGDQYWRFTNMKLDRGYPKMISQGFGGVPDNVDAAFVWSGNGKIYFFKGSKYWKFDPSNSQPLRGYPRQVRNWEGVPSNLDDALQYSNGYTYFFKDGKYWRFNDRRFEVDFDPDTPFPRDAGQWWFGCSKDNLESPAGTSRPQQPEPSNSDVNEDSFDAVSAFLDMVSPGIN